MSSPSTSLPERWRLDNLHSLEALVWDVLEESADRAEAPWRTPVVSTTGAVGRLVDARVMILRAASRARGELTCYTDTRSPKFATIRSCPCLAWTFYDPAEKVQLRVASGVEVHVEDDLAHSVWHTIPEGKRKDYSTRLPPGAAIAAPMEGHDFRSAIAAHFAVLVARVVEMDWLWLAPDGHRRARFRYASNGALASAEWLVP